MVLHLPKSFDRLVDESLDSALRAGNLVDEAGKRIDAARALCLRNRQEVVDLIQEAAAENIIVKQVAAQTSTGSYQLNREWLERNGKKAVILARIGAGGDLDHAYLDSASKLYTGGAVQNWKEVDRFVRQKSSEQLWSPTKITTEKALWLATIASSGGISDACDGSHNLLQAATAIDGNGREFIQNFDPRSYVEHSVLRGADQASSMMDFVGRGGPGYFVISATSRLFQVPTHINRIMISFRRPDGASSQDVHERFLRINSQMAQAYQVELAQALGTQEHQFRILGAEVMDEDAVRIASMAGHSGPTPDDMQIAVMIDFAQFSKRPITDEFDLIKLLVQRGLISETIFEEVMSESCRLFDVSPLDGGRTVSKFDEWRLAAPDHARVIKKTTGAYSRSTDLGLLASDEEIVVEYGMRMFEARKALKAKDSDALCPVYGHKGLRDTEHSRAITQDEEAFEAYDKTCNEITDEVIDIERQGGSVRFRGEKPLTPSDTHKKQLARGLSDDAYAANLAVEVGLDPAGVFLLGETERHEGFAGLHAQAAQYRKADLDNGGTGLLRLTAK